MKLIAIFFRRRNLDFATDFQEFFNFLMIRKGDVVGEEILSRVKEILGEKLFDELIFLGQDSSNKHSSKFFPTLKVDGMDFS